MGGFGCRIGFGGQYRVEGLPIVFIVLPFFGLTFWDPTYKAGSAQKNYNGDYRYGFGRLGMDIYACGSTGASEFVQRIAWACNETRTAKAEP